MILWWRKKKDEVNDVKPSPVIREEDLDGLTVHEMLDLVRAIERGEDFRRKSDRDGLYIGDVRDALGNYLGSYLHPKDKITHMAVFGSTGMGKSTLLAMIARHLMLLGEGVSIFDPHGELARDILSLVPPERVKDVIFIDPAFFEASGKVIRINPLEYDPNDPSSRERAAQDFMTPLRKLYAEFWGPRLERILYHAMKLLLSFPPGEVQLLDLYDLIMNDKRREELVIAAREFGLDPATERFWLFEFTGYKEEAVQAVLTKITQLLSNTYSSMVFNSETGISDIDLREVLNKRKILIVSTPVGILREVPAQFISAFIITRYFLAAMERINVAGAQAVNYPDHWVIIDEAHIAESQALIDIITQARKYKLHVILATQYPNQFSEEVKSAILNNASIIITFKNGPDAADDLARIFQIRKNEFEERKLEIMNLPRYMFLAKFQDDPIPRSYFTNNLKESLKDELVDWKLIADTSMQNYAKDLLREYSYMPLLTRESIVMLGQFLSLSGTIIPPQYIINEPSFLRLVELKYKQYKIDARSDEAFLELKSQGLLTAHEGRILPGKLFKEYIERIERIPPVAKNTIMKYIFNSFIYIPQKTPNLLTPDIIIDKNGRRKKGRKIEEDEETTQEKIYYVYITPSEDEKERIEKQKARFIREKRNIETIIIDREEDTPFNKNYYMKINTIEKELTALTIIFSHALREPLETEIATKLIAQAIAKITTPTTLTPTIEEISETQAIIDTLKNAGMIQEIQQPILNTTINILIPTETAIKEYFAYTPSQNSIIKAKQAYLIQKTLHALYTNLLTITKTHYYPLPHPHDPYTTAPDILIYLLTQKGYEPHYAIEIETEDEHDELQILINYYKNQARNLKPIFITDTEKKAEQIRNILKTEGIQLPAILVLPQTPHDEALQKIYEPLNIDRSTEEIKTTLTQYYMKIIHDALMQKIHKLIKTTIITTIENLYNMIKKPSEQTTQLYKTTIEQITNMPDPRPLLQLSIRTTNDQQPEQFLQQLLTQILQTIQSTSTTEVATKPEETVAQQVVTTEKPETVQTITTEVKSQAAPATVATTAEQTAKTEEISELAEKTKGEVTKMTQEQPQESKQEASTKETKQETQTKEQEKERTAKEKPEKKREGKPKEKKKEAETTQAETQKITQPPSASPAETPSTPTPEHEKIRTAILDIVKELTQKASPTKEDIINTLQNKQYIIIKGDIVFITADFLYNITQRANLDAQTLIQTFNILKTTTRIGNKPINAYKLSRNTFEQLIT